MNKLTILRLGKGWSMRELGRRAGVTNVCIHLIECGKRRYPRADTLIKLAKALGVSVEDLIT
jgi:transcriptional regulator with XRE-family HTH domain